MGGTSLLVLRSDLPTQPPPEEDGPSSRRQRTVSSGDLAIEASARESRLFGQPIEGLDAGKVLGGKYQLKRSLGSGGMGSVWLAHNTALDIPVAIKVVKPGGRQDGATERVLQEARAAARIDHPAIVRVTDFGSTELGHPFLVMEALNGEDLGARIEREGKANPIEAVRTLLPIAHALAAAHEKGIVHRDLKPDNIFLAKLEHDALQPKLIDFGIAKIEMAASDRITAQGVVMGSSGYLSPEQAAGADVDARSDIWSFSVVLYELLAGELPFREPNQLALLRAIIQKEPTSLLDNGTVDAGLWSVLAKGLAKEPDQRWESIRAMGAALAEWLVANGVSEDICSGSLDSIWLRRRGSYPESAPAMTGPISTSQTALLQVDAEARISTVPAQPARAGLSLPLALALLGVGAVGIGAAVYFTRAEPVPPSATSAQSSPPLAVGSHDARLAAPTVTPEPSASAASSTTVPATKSAVPSQRALTPKAAVPTALPKPTQSAAPTLKRPTF